MNTKKTSPTVATRAGQVLGNPKASEIQKSLAGSALSQVNKGNQTGAKIEGVASKALQSNKYSNTTKSLAGSALSQSDKKR